jgi:hypothetical protein
MINKSLIFKLRLVLKLSKEDVCSKLSINETELDSVESLKLAPPPCLISYYSLTASVRPKYLKMLFIKKRNLLDKVLHSFLHFYFDMIIRLRNVSENKK